ncbi:HpcH/HpaI aldolase/citrate lyase family protein [uncultured Plantibacter sp.]|uniref:HpcH/HpaI aldolase family protein n=1 Tax=uncultured Plantibacter sp. TaxID=293337 RepID=UPI0028D474F8|nr:HpcH/HpaI aldolase/citrate lyase family protein [uncultured Plantibacter sp.]
MPIRMTLPPTFGERLRTADRPLAGMWVVSGSPIAAEIAAGSGLDLLLIDGEHSANTLESIQLQLQVVAAFPVCPLVRVPFGDAVVIKRVLDLGAQNLIVPMVSSAEQAAALVQAVRYPPQGVRGVGSALARSSRWNRVDDYLAQADDSVSLTVQIESAEAVEQAEDILAVDGVDAVFVGPADLSASLGLLGQQGHPTVVSAVERVLDAAAAAGKPAGVNAFDPGMAEHYLDRGASFVLVGADVSLLARASEQLAERFVDGRSDTSRSDGY